MPKDIRPLPDWERVLSAAARLQEVPSDAVLAGGTPAAIDASHRRSRDADHVIMDLKDRFDAVLAQLESVAGWKLARERHPVLIQGSLDGIETGVRQLIREAPLETAVIEHASARITLPTLAEILCIKAVLVLRRNAMRDYVDLVALADHMGAEAAADALEVLDELYPQAEGQSALQQLLAQLASPMPYDLEETDLSKYEGLDPRWHSWPAVAEACGLLAAAVFEHLDGPAPSPGRPEA